MKAYHGDAGRSRENSENMGFSCRSALKLRGCRASSDAGHSLVRPPFARSFRDPREAACLEAANQKLSMVVVGQVGNLPFVTENPAG
jgi:hypothetical protein